MMKRFFLVMLLGWWPVSGAELAKGDVVQLTLRGVDGSEGAKVSGEYTVDDAGRVRLPWLENAIPVVGLTPAGFARRAEEAYRASGIYSSPAIEVVALKAKEAPGATISIGGSVKSNGPVPFRQGMTVQQALNAAGGQDMFAGRNLYLIRKGEQYCLDLTQAAHLNIEVRANDTLQVEERPALFDFWKGKPERVAELMR